MGLRQKVWLLMFFCIVAGGQKILAQDHIAQPDTVILHPDSLAVTDTIPPKQGLLEAPVTYQAKDSIVLTAGNMAYLYGEGDVKYQKIQLQAELIEMNLDSNVVFATFDVDSTGVEFGYPIYSDGDNEPIEAKIMRYNFKTRKAHTTNTLTKQGEGFLTAQVTKMMANNTIHLHNGRYTTCDDHDCPHYYINITKAKTRPGKDLVSGPLWLVIADVPLPLALPFAFFPFNQTYSSGIIMPTYGEDMSRGFFLREGGYYFALSDYADLALKGDYYSKGSWALSARTEFRKRYKYSGGFDINYLTTIVGDKGFDDYNVQKAFKLSGRLLQDPKANPYRTISASINFSTNQHDRNDIKSQAMLQTTENNKSSSINITQRFPNSPWNISATMNINQSSRDSTLSVTLPTLMINMSMTAPFKRKNAIGPELWYEKIKLSYTGNLQNSIQGVKESEFLKQNVIRDWRNGMNHQIPVSATYSLLGYINTTISANYQERWYTSKDYQTYDTISNQLVKDTTHYGFYRVYDYNTSVSAGTTLYGFYKPWSIFGGFVNMIRHRMEPSISLSWRPDFGNPKYGYYEAYSYIRNGVEMFDTYSPYKNQAQLFGLPGTGRQGSITFSVNNNIEAKIRSNQDSTGLKKISLIDNLSWGISYNMAADSMRWSQATNVGLRMKLTKSYTLNLNMGFDTYIYTYDENLQRPVRIDVPRWKVGKGLGRLQSTGTSIAYTFDNNSMKTTLNNILGLFGKGGDEGDNRSGVNQPDNLDVENTTSNMSPNTQAPGARLRNAKPTQTGENDENGYYNAKIPWSFNVNYSMDLVYNTGSFNKEKMEYDYKITHRLSFGGNIQPTDKWRLTFNGSYDFEMKKIPFLTLNVSRELHCFQMSASIVPVGARKSYMFSIAVSSSLLKDLKYNQSSNYWNGLSWY